MAPTFFSLFHFFTFSLFLIFAHDMKKVACLLLAVMTVFSVFAEDDEPQVQKRKKVAVVLSGGGAKGVAHIGALKVIEKAGLPIDIITGTSMGSLVGGLYAIGYNAHSLDSIARHMDWAYVLSDKEDLSRQSIEDRKRQTTYMLSRGLTRMPVVSSRARTWMCSCRSSAWAIPTRWTSTVCPSPLPVWRQTSSITAR